MATQAEKTPTAPSRATQLDQYVNRQLRKTTRQVRFSDVITGLLILGAYTLAFFLMAAVIDAWIWPLNTVARASSLALFVVGLLAITWYALLPLFLKQINPQYAARMIEEGQPGFKNSLLNYLALKRGGHRVHRAILNEVSKRAANDLSTVTIDSAVDKTNIIRAGFILVGLVAICVAYLIFSPKNPLPTVMRVLSPGAKIARPAAVRIRDVSPGDTSVFFGERLQVTARIIGKCDENDVRLVYSSKDQQVVDAVVPMEPSGGHGTWSAMLETGRAGIQQPLDYYIAARDGVSPRYSVDVRPNPSITVDSIQITPPAYTGLPSRTMEGSGEIQAVEGSRIDIAATANLPIELAYIVPLVARDDRLESESFRELRSINMKSEGTQATGHFLALLNARRDRALFTHYKIKFRSRNDHENTQANTYPVRVIADLAPEVEILQPRQKEIALPANQPLRVEIQASDLDYEISSVDLHIDHQGTAILDRNLHLNTDGQNVGEVVQVAATLSPADLNLEPGDRAILFATASDNRISPSSQLPDPNVTRTDNYTLIITEPIENPEPVGPDQESEESPEQRDPANRQPSDQPTEGGNGKSDQPMSDPNQADESEQPREQSDQNPTEPQSQDAQSQPGEQQSSQGSQSSRPADSGNQSRQQDGGQSGSDGNQSEMSDPESQDGTEDVASQSEGDDPSGQEQSATPDNQSGQTRNQGNNAGGQQDVEGDSATGSSSNADGGQQGGDGESAAATGQDGDNRAGEAEQGERRDQSLQDGDIQPLSENASEGEQFERLKQYFDENAQRRDELSDVDDSRESGESSEPSSNETDNPGPDGSTGSDAANQTETIDDGSSSGAETDGLENQPPSNEQNETAAGGSDVPKADAPENSSAPSDNNVQDNADASSSGNPDPGGGRGKEGRPSQPGDSSDRSKGTGSDPAQSPHDGTADRSPESDAPGDSDRPPSANTGSNSDRSPDGSRKSEGSAGDSTDPQQQTDPSAASNSESASADQKGSPDSEAASSGSSNDDTSSAPSSSAPASSSQDGEAGTSSSSASGGNQETPTSRSDPTDTDSSPRSDGERGQPSPSQNPSTSAEQDGESGSSRTDSQSQDSRSANDANMSRGDATKNGGMPGAGGQTSQQSDSAADQPADPEQANLEYSQKVTDLVLNKLEEQKFDPDPELLDQMNWTKQDLERFLKQWQEMKARAGSGDAKARQTYEEALRSLGLRRSTRSRKVDVRQDDPFQLNEDGAVDQIPSEYVDQFNSFLKRRNRSKRNRQP